jgi:hypothetical protein
MPLTNAQVYERAASNEENVFVEVAMEFVWNAPKPPGWTRRKTPGRPRKRGRGRPEELHWRAAAVILLLMEYLGMDYRRMAAHLRARPDLVQRLELRKAPKKSNLHRAHTRIREAWLRELNDQVTAAFKRGEGPRRST